MAKLRKLYIPLFVVLLSGFVTLFNQVHQFHAFSANSHTTFATSNNGSSLQQLLHHQGAARLLAELPDLEEESDSENDRISSALKEPEGFHLPTTVTTLSRHLFELPASSWLYHSRNHEESYARIPLYKRVCVFRI